MGALFKCLEEAEETKRRMRGKTPEECAEIIAGHLERVRRIMGKEPKRTTSPEKP